MSDEFVLVTGGSGFLGLHCIAALLREGYQVRTTVRSLAVVDEVRAAVSEAGVDASGLEFAPADLTQDKGWIEAVAGCDYVLHTASPFPMGAPAHEDELLGPAVGGVERVLGAAVDAGVRRVVLTSSAAAVAYGVPLRDRPFTEADWSDPTGPIDAYAKSKTLAERRAWELVAGTGTELVSVNPVLILGPLLGRRPGTSLQIVQRLLRGAYPALPRLSFGVVDVRDVADLHVLALRSPEAAGQRLIASAPPVLWLADVARELRAGLGADARRVPVLPVPNWTVRIAALFDPALRLVAADLGTLRETDNARARSLGWSPRSPEEAVLAAGRSLLDAGLV